jgi:hypothetical protein
LSGTEHPALVIAARCGLADDDTTVAPALDDIGEIVRIARLDRLGGLLYAAVQAGSIDVGDEAAAAIRQLWHEQLVASVTVEALAVRTAGLLDAAGIAWRLTKGPALAHLDYPDPALRAFGDVDVVVHPHSWRDAVGALAEAGWHRELPELAPGFDDRFGKGATITTQEGLEVDLHRRLAIGRFGVRLPTDELFHDVATVTLGGRDLPALDGPSRLLHACYHAALGGFRHLRAHRDIAQLLLMTSVDWHRTVDVASRHRVDAVVARAVVDAWAALRLELHHPAHCWAVEQRIGRADARALAVFAAERPFREQALTAVPVLAGRDAVAYLYALAGQPGRQAWSPQAVARRARRAVRGRDIFRAGPPPC